MKREDEVKSENRAIGWTMLCMARKEGEKE